jgi:hypothetical protein
MPSPHLTTSSVGEATYLLINKKDTEAQIKLAAQLWQHLLQKNTDRLVSEFKDVDDTVKEVTLFLGRPHALGVR